MKVLILLSVVAMSYAQHWNNPNWAVPNNPAAPVQDTPEVAAAKAAHFAAVSREQGLQNQHQWSQPQNNWNQQPNQWNQPQNNWNQQNEPIKKWYGPLALPPGYDRNGAPLPVQDTPEVAAERARHFTLTGGFGAQGQQYGPPPAAPQWNQWNHNNGGHGRWRRSLVATTAAIAPVAYTSHVLTAPIVHYAAAPVLAHW